jgi:hypothetical protein
LKRTWHGVARFESSAVVSAPPDRAWSLLSSPEVWSLAGEHMCVFETPAPPPDAGDRLWFCVGVDGGGQVFGLPMAVTASALCLDVRAGGGERTWRLSADPARRGTRLRIGGTARTRREQVVETEAQLRGGLAGWLGQMRAVLAGSRPWPDAGVPGPLRAAALAVPQPQGALEVAVTAELAVPAAQAARLLRAPEVITAIQAARQVQSAGMLWFGMPPGDTPGEAGALSCMLASTPAGALAASVAVCIDSSADGYVTRQLQWPYDQTARTIMAAGDGSRLELRQRILPRQPELQPEEHRARRRAGLEKLAERLKTAIEDAAVRGTGL